MAKQHAKEQYGSALNSNSTQDAISECEGNDKCMQWASEGIDRYFFAAIATYLCMLFLYYLRLVIRHNTKTHPEVIEY